MGYLSLLGWPASHLNPAFHLRTEFPSRVSNCTCSTTNMHEMHAFENEPGGQDLRVIEHPIVHAGVDIPPFPTCFIFSSP